VHFVIPKTKKQASSSYLFFSCCVHAACVLVKHLKLCLAVCDSHRCGTHHSQCMANIYFATIDFKSKDSHLCLCHGAHVRYPRVPAKKWFSLLCPVRSTALKAFDFVPNLLNEAYSAGVSCSMAARLPNICIRTIAQRCMSACGCVVRTCLPLTETTCWCT
jgi:hypothetical protein